MTPGALTPSSWLETKLLLPRPRPLAVGRPRLEQLLSRGLGLKLTLVSAPPGFGKTTLLSSWLAHQTADRRTAWVSLDERDRDLSSFWSYVLLAVDRAAPGSAAAALAQLQTGQTPLESVLAVLLNELSVLPDDLTVVLDDYHRCDGAEIRPGMTFLLDHLPPQVHVVISTRADPALPLGRLRALGELVEVRAVDLRFTVAEASAYLNEVAALGLPAAGIAALDGRTEGWIAALQLAALSLQGRDDSAGFIAGFAGDDRYVLDYLADEVLNRQSAQVRRFLLDTSVLEALTGSLCDAVTGGAGGKAMLESLDRQNLFVVPLDDHRRWYRYHHLFADVLTAHLVDERPGDVNGLHRRASEWYDRAGDPEHAIRHALAAGDNERAADLIELAIPDLRRQRREAVIRRWSDELPADTVKNRPVLAVGAIGALMASNEFNGVDQRLSKLEQLLAEPADDLVVVDHAELRRIPGAIETYRAALALVSGDLPATVSHAQLALTRASEDDLLTFASASALMGLARWTSGNLAEAQRAYTTAAEGLTRAGHVSDVLGCSLAITDIEITLGRLREVQRTLEQALELAERSGPGPIRGTADMYVALSTLAWERGNPAPAAEYLRRADELGEPAGLPQNPYRWRVAVALLREAEGDTTTALGLLDEAERVYVGDFSPNVRPIAASRARVAAAAGEVPAALAWARHSGLSVTDDLSYLREYEHVTLARVLLADHAARGNAAALTEATSLLERLLAAAEKAARLGTVVEVLVLLALASQAAGQDERALATLERAARLAEPEGYVRVFTREGATLLTLLHALCGRHRDWTYAWRLREAATPRPSAGNAPAQSVHGRSGSGTGVVAAATPRNPVLIDPLSSRELDVLRYLDSELDGPAIARALSVSLATVRTHTQHIYAKLGVNNRRAAVRRAHQLNLFHSAGD